MKSISVGVFAGMMGCAFVQSILAAGAANESVVYSFSGGTDGSWPRAGVIDAKGTLYGTTHQGGGRGCGGNGCGTVFALDRKIGTEKVLYFFCSQQNCTDGAIPGSGVIDIKGTLYGTTYEGGGTGCNSYGCGTAFAIDLKTGGEKLLYSFCSQQNCADGSVPNGLIDMKGVLYGETANGGGTGCGGNGCGTVFVLDSKTGTEKVLYSFCSQQNCTDGAIPDGLIDVSGTLYGTTYGGGNTQCAYQYGCGIMFSLDPETDEEKVLYSFCSQQSCTDGENPNAGLLDVKGALYGTTYEGGTGCVGIGCGTAFSLDPKSGAERVLYSFCSQYDCPDGEYPEGGVIDVNGILYGTTSTGGGIGTVFALDPKTGAETVLHDFGDSGDGAEPEGSLIDVKGTLYGTTYAGGANCADLGGCGTVFELKKR